MRTSRTLLFSLSCLALSSAACFTPADFGAGVAAEEHGEAEQAPDEHAEGEQAAADEEYVIEGIQPGTQGETLEIKLPEIPYEAPFDGKPLSAKEVEGGVKIEEFVLGEGEAVGPNMMIAFNFKGYASANGRQVMGSRAAPSKLVINDAAMNDPIAKAMAAGLEGMKPGGKRRVKIPAEIVEEGAPPGRPAVGDLWITVELVSVEEAPVLEGVEAYAGTPIASKKLSNGLEIYDYRAGEGDTAKNGDKVVTHYIGHLADGTEFDSSHSRAEGLPVVVGGPGVIKGFSLGVEGAKKGMLRKIVIPPELGYGDTDRGKIPPNSTLTFYLQITEVSEGSTGPQLQAKIPRKPEGAGDDKPKPKPKPKPADDADGGE
jgi:FKBP-type peptidyl-prolyl cis-trans isomerase